jgi:signal transduction histidine kinase
MLPVAPAHRRDVEVRAPVETFPLWREMVRHTMWKSLVDILPRGNTLAEADWQRRHRLLQWVLLVHVPVLAVIGLVLHNPVLPLTIALTIPVLCAIAGRLLRHRRRWGSAAVSAGLVWCSTALVGITDGTIESHFHFFIIIGFIALYQDWVPFLLNVLFTVITHGVGSMWLRTLMFNHPAAQANPWLWSIIHGVAVLLACVGVMLFWRVTEDEQTQKDDLTRKLADAEIGRRRFTSDMLVNLARRNQSMLYRQMEIINQLEESERNPDALAELFRLDHLTTRVRRNAENLLVLSGEKPPRVWSQPVPLRDVVRAAIAETEDLDRVAFEIPEGPLVDGASVTDLTHLLAELTENAVRFSPPDMAVTIRGRRDPRGGQGQLLTVEDWGVGMEDADLASANALLAAPPEVDLSVSKRLGFHVVARLAARHGIRVVLSPTPGSGITASVALPGSMFELGPEPVGALIPAVPATAARPGRSAPRPGPDRTKADHGRFDRPALDYPALDYPALDYPALDYPALDYPALDRNGTDRPALDYPALDRNGTDRNGTDRGTDIRPLIPLPRPPLAAETLAAETVGASPSPSPTPSPTPGPRPEGAAPDWPGWWNGPGSGQPETPGDDHPDLAPAATGVSTPRAIPRVEQMVEQRSEPTLRRPTPLAGAPTATATDVTTEIETAAATTGSTTGSTSGSTTGSTTGETNRPRPALRRRVPQAHLSPGLRTVPADTEPAGPEALPVAAEALSRYQASRAAARSVVDDEPADERSTR